jgi:predicted ATP-dependent Lon-type protease
MRCYCCGVEMRRRVADQLRIIAPKEFAQVAFGFHVNRDNKTPGVARTA